MLRDENTKGRCTLGRRGWPWLAVPFGMGVFLTGMSLDERRDPGTPPG